MVLRLAECLIDACDYPMKYYISHPAMALVSIRASKDLQKLEIVNQLLLPHVTEYIAINSVEDAHEAIKSMKVRDLPVVV